MLLTGGLILLGVVALLLSFFVARGASEQRETPRIYTGRVTQEPNIPIGPPKEITITQAPDTIIREEQDIVSVSNQLNALTEKLQTLQRQINDVEEHVAHLNSRHG